MTSFKTVDFKIVTCDCFYYNWRKIRQNQDETWNFNDIEGGKETLRKMFHEHMTIFHCCNSCLHKAIIMNQISIPPNSVKGYCILSIKAGRTPIEKICNVCTWLLIEKFKEAFKHL